MRSLMELVYCLLSILTRAANSTLNSNELDHFSELELELEKIFFSELELELE